MAQAQREQAERDRRTRLELERLPAETLFARFSPRRTRWRDIAEFDERVGALELRRADLQGEIADLDNQLRQSTAAHEAQLADFFGAGEKGPRPISEAAELEARIADRRADHEAAAVALDRVLTAKIKYVEAHRKRLSTEAAKATAAARDHYADRVREAAAARDELVAARANELWAAGFPEQAATELPGFVTALCLGLTQPIEAALPGVKSQLPAANVFALLEQDASTVATMATARQAELLGAKRTRTPTSEAMWAGDPDHVEWQKQRRREFLARAEYATPQELAEMGEAVRG